MSIWNKVLIGLILVLSVVFFFMGARALNAHRNWQQLARDLKEKLGEQEAARKELEGSPEDPSTLGLLPEAKLDLRKLLVDRGRLWHNCSPQQVQFDNQAGEVLVSLTTDLPDPHGIAVKTVLFIFEEKKIEADGAYLGQFIVTAAPPKRLELRPSRMLSQRQYERLESSQKSQTRWVLYEVMPADRHDVLAEIGENKLREMFPDDTEEEYVKDGQSMSTDDVGQLGLEGKVVIPQRTKVSVDGKEVEVEVDAPIEQGSGKYVRQLRDYDLLFGVYHGQRSMALDETQAATRDLQYLQNALADAKQQEQFRHDEIGGLKKELAECAAERDAVAAYRKALEDKLSAVKADVEEMIKTNQALAGEIARIQLEATRRIDEQTRRMAQAGGVR